MSEGVAMLMFVGFMVAAAALHQWWGRLVDRRHAARRRAEMERWTALHQAITEQRVRQFAASRRELTG